MHVDLRLVVHALSDALDLVGINDVHHGKRVGVMAVDILRQLGEPVAVQERTFDAGLVHDIGVSSTDLHHQLVEDFDWEGSEDHAVYGAHLLGGFPPLAGLVPIILHHHTHWSVLKDNYGADERLSNLIFLADRIDVLAAVAMLNNRLQQDVPTIRERIAAQAGEMFDPELVAAFMEVSKSDAFWLALEPDSIRDTMEQLARVAQPVDTDLATLHALAELFSHVVDAKSRFTVEHSEGVARIAHCLGELAGLDEETSGKMEIAGLLHDIGKLRIPDALLDKPGPLEPHERRQMASHAFETHRILTRIPGFEDIARWAAFHHESPDGEGYPFRLKGNDLSLEARLIRAADIFQAMSQDRPYRQALPARAVLEHMRRLRDAGKLDGDIYELLAGHLGDLYRLAQPQGGVAA
jgi:HD-GYP domain-containing protein (c-di-GMP phosphodiesterase class II)